MSNTFGTLDALSRIPAPMPETMSPREKVVHTQACEHCRRDTRVNPAPILAALASSGDHAELARLAEAATPGPWVSQGRYIGTPNHMSYVGEVRDQNGNWSDTTKSRSDAAFIAAANPASVLALLAEIASQRSDGEVYQNQADHEFLLRKEAERKLAEAVGLNERAAELMRQCTDPERFEGASTLNVYANMRAWLSDLPPAPGAEDE